MKNIVVEPSVFAFVENIEGEPGEAIGNIISVLLMNDGKFPSAVCDKVIPDNAPAEIKNAMAKKCGDTYRIAIKLDDGTMLYTQWFVSDSLNCVWIFNIQYPVDIQAS